MNRQAPRSPQAGKQLADLKEGPGGWQGLLSSLAECSSLSRDMPAWCLLSADSKASHTVMHSPSQGDCRWWSWRSGGGRVSTEPTKASTREAASKFREHNAASPGHARKQAESELCCFCSSSSHNATVPQGEGRGVPGGRTGLPQDLRQCSFKTAKITAIPHHSIAQRRVLSCTNTGNGAKY